MVTQCAMKMNQIKPLTTVVIATKIIIFCNISIFFLLHQCNEHVCNRGGRITRYPNFRINYLLAPYIFSEWRAGIFLGKIAYWWKRIAFAARIEADICPYPVFLINEFNESEASPDAQFTCSHYRDLLFTNYSSSCRGGQSKSDIRIQTRQNIPRLSRLSRNDSYSCREF